MATTPTSSSSSSSSTSTPLLSPGKQSSSPPSLDALVENCIGQSVSLTQIFQVFLVSSAWFFDAQQVFISVFADAQPQWHCTSPDCNPYNPTPCSFPPNSWSYNSPSSSSTISDFNIFCSPTSSSDSFLSSLPATSFFVGSLLGIPSLSFLADLSLGRKRTLLLSTSLLSISSLSISLSSNPLSYSLLRFLSGFGRANLGSCALLLSAESVGKKWRARVGMFGFSFFTLGFLSLPAIAYVNRACSWRMLYFWTSTPALLYCLLLALFAKESPRWLMLKGREEEAVGVLRWLGGDEVTRVRGCFILEEGEVDTMSALGMLVRKRWAMRRLVLIMLASVGTGPVYYGMPLAVGSLSANLYVSVALNALSEVPAVVVSMVVIEKVGRRWGMAWFAAATCVMSVMCGVGREGGWGRVGVVGMELVAFFCGVTAMNVGHILAMELFPTCVRNSAVAVVRAAVMGGGVVSPVLAAAGRGNGLLSFGVFGLGAGLCCVCALMLPETRGKTLCDTMEEEERLAASSSPSTHSHPSFLSSI